MYQNLALKLKEYMKNVEWHADPFQSQYGVGLVRTDDSVSNVALVVRSDMVLTRALVLTIAQDNELLEQMIKSDPYGQDPLNQTPTSVLLLHFLLLQILKIRRGTPDPLFGAWVRSLPPGKDIDVPYVKDEEVIDKELLGTSIHKATRGKLHSLRKRHLKFSENKDVLRKIAEFVLSGPGKLKLEDLSKFAPDLVVSFDDFVLCEQWISSRCLGAGHLDVDKIMCPAVDLANHSDNENSAYDFEEDGSLVLYSQASVGEEVTINYGSDKGAGEYLFNYGFIPAGWKTAKVSKFYYSASDAEIRQIYGAASEAENKDDSDISYDILIRFLDRPVQNIHFHEIHSASHDEFLFLWSARAFLELVMQDGFYELHFCGREIDLERIEACVKGSKVYESGIKPMVEEYTRDLARHFYRKLEANVSGNELVKLEKALLEKFIN